MLAMFLAALSCPNDTLHIGAKVADPLLSAAQLLIPAGVATAGLHKLMQHQETGGGFLVDMLVKGGGAILVIAMIKVALQSIC